MEREVGGGIGMGNTCKPMAVSSQRMTKFTTKKKNDQYSLVIICHRTMLSHYDGVHIIKCASVSVLLSLTTANLAA